MRKISDPFLQLAFSPVTSGRLLDDSFPEHGTCCCICDWRRVVMARTILDCHGTKRSICGGVVNRVGPSASKF